MQSAAKYQLLPEVNTTQITIKLPDELKELKEAISELLKKYSITDIRKALRELAKEQLPESDCWIEITEKICFVASLVDQVYFVADTIDTIAGLAPYFLVFSKWGLGVGGGVGICLALCEAFCHKINCLVNKTANSPTAEEVENINVPIKYKIPVAGHFISDMFDWGGRLTMLANLLYPEARLLYKVAAKGFGLAIGAINSKAETQAIYTSFKRFCFWKQEKEKTVEESKALIEMQARV